MRRHLSDFHGCVTECGLRLRRLWCIFARRLTITMIRCGATYSATNSRARSGMRLCRTPQRAALIRRVAAKKKRDIFPGLVFHEYWPLRNVAGFKIALEETGHEMPSRNQGSGAGGRWLRV